MGKHLEKKKKTNTKKRMILLFIIILLTTLITMLVIKVINKNNLEVKVTHTINNAFESLKEGNIEESNKYLNYNSLISILDKDILNEENLLKYELNKELFNSLEWNIKEIEIEKDDTIEVAIEIKNKDYSEIIMKWLKLIIKEENGNILTNEQCAEKIKEVILNDEIKTATEIRKITLMNNEEKLHIIVNDELGNGLFPKIEKLNEVLSEIE